MALLARPAFSIFQDVYLLIQRSRSLEWIQLTPAVRREIAAISNVAFLLKTDFSQPWLGKALMTDASPTGGALVSTDATASQCREEAAWASSGGWVVNLEEEGDLTTECRTDTGPETSSSSTCRSSQSSLGSPGRRLKIWFMRLLHLFAGHPRE